VRTLRADSGRCDQAGVNKDGKVEGLSSQTTITIRATANGAAATRYGKTS